jgi:hypothetical protein
MQGEENSCRFVGLVLEKGLRVSLPLCYISRHVFKDDCICVSSQGVISKEKFIFTISRNVAGVSLTCVKWTC